MSRRLLLVVSLIILSAGHAVAQFSDTFSDGDFTRQPTWTGTTEHWAILPFGDNFALHSDGTAASDTIYLATPSEISRGTWSLTFAYSEVNLSNFNGARVFLMADTDRLDGVVYGYFLQFGASNSDELRFYRQDGDARAKRVLLGQSTAPLLDGESQMLSVAVTRSDAYEWQIVVNGSPVFTTTDSTYTTSRFTGVWVKHTPATARSFVFDDFNVQGEAGPTDTLAPYLHSVEALDAVRVEVTFSETVDGCYPNRYTFSKDLGPPEAIETCSPEGQASYVLRPASPLVNGTTYTLVVTHIPDPSGNVLHEATATFTFIDPATPPPQPGTLVVNEIYYDPPHAALEFIEIFNRSDQLIDLRRVSFSDDRFEPIPLYDKATALKPGAYAVIARDSTAFRAAFPDVAATEPPSWPTLNNDGDAVALFAGDLRIDVVPYHPGWGGAGVSLERKDPDGPSTAAFNFGSSIHPAGATPGAVNSLYAPDRSPPFLLFAEQVDQQAIDLFFDEPLAMETVRPSAFTLDDGRSPSTLAVGPDAMHLRLRFDTPLTGLRLHASGIQDLTGNAVSDETTSELAYLAEPGDLVVTEIMYAPTADRFDNRPDQPEYVEMVNQSGHRLTLRRHYWTNRPDEIGQADTLRFGDAFFSLAPDRFAVVFAAADGSTNPYSGSTLAQAFPEVDFAEEAATLIPIYSTTLSLRNDGALIHLHRPDDTSLDSVAYNPSWHHPNLIETGGVALERITMEGAANKASHWSSSVAPSGGTPGRPNSVALAPGGPIAAGNLVITPSPFSPDHDGVDDVAAIQYNLVPSTSLIRARIFDARGRLVRTLTDAHLASRTGRLIWDGLDDAGQALPIGIYIILFEALDTRGGASTAFKKAVVLARSFN